MHVITVKKEAMDMKACEDGLEIGKENENCYTLNHYYKHVQRAQENNRKRKSIYI